MNRIKEVRQKKNISLYRLSKETGIAYKNLWRIEHDADTRVSTLKKIADALDCNASDLIN